MKSDFLNLFHGGNFISGSSIESFKLLAETIPPSAGITLNYLPFMVRMGKDYMNYSTLIDYLLKADHKTRIDFLIRKMDLLLKHHIQKNQFYNQFLKEADCKCSGVRDINNITCLPVITKARLKEMSFDKRLITEHGLKRVNTGGTSGSTLSFFLDSKFYAREWSHIHYMWKRIGYYPTMTKITLRGKDVNDIYKYRFNQNEFLLNSFQKFDSADYAKLLKIFKKYNTTFIHGYPSSIFNFLKEISIDAPSLLDFLKKNIKGIMFVSEYPSPCYREYIEDMLTPNTISFYGHTEGTIIAGELFQKDVYVPFMSYGYAEALNIDNLYHLVGTSFDNFVTPFIRYDTEDLINPEFDMYGMLKSFSIKEGRLGEFVKDKNDRNISLTSLIFGRHHKLFDRVKFIQVRQKIPGSIEILYCNPTPVDNPSEYFDSSNVNMDVLFKQVKEPYKTAVGKVPLLIN